MKTTILKFGGTSVGSTSSMKEAVEIILDTSKNNQVVVVVSATGGSTSDLIKLIDYAKRQKPKLIAGDLNRMVDRHREMLANFIPQHEIQEVWDRDFAPLFEKLRTILTGISYVGELADKSYAVILSYGERISSRIMHHALFHAGVDVARIDATRLIRTDSNFSQANVDFGTTRKNFKRIAGPPLKKGRVIITEGFIGKDTSGDVTLLGRGGSDFTASIAAVSLDADQIEIWTDVDGIMSADPRIVSKPRIWESVDISVMAEMAYSGAKVIHPKTIIPALTAGIPVRIKNTFNKDATGTLVFIGGRSGLVGITADKSQTLIHLTNANMLDDVGFIHSCSAICKKYGVPIDVCATSEISLTISIHEEDYSQKLRRDLEKIAEVKVDTNIAKVCIIGSKISHETKFLERIFSILRSFEIYAVSSGSSYNNVTLLVGRLKADEILTLLHKKLFS